MKGKIQEIFQKSTVVGSYFQTQILIRNHRVANKGFGVANKGLGLQIRLDILWALCHSGLSSSKFNDSCQSM